MQALLFDLDGTLVDSLPLIRFSYAKVFDELGLPWGNDEVMKLIGLPLKDIGRHFAGDRADLFCETYQRYYHQVHDRMIALIPGTAEMLTDAAAANLKLGIVTSKGRPGTERTLSFFNLNHFFKVVITAEDAPRSKPNPDPILLALNRLGVRAPDACYVGDSPFDIAAGREAGTIVLGVTWGMAKPEELTQTGAQQVLTSWTELTNFYKK